jgi:hypothetical protein
MSEEKENIKKKKKGLGLRSLVSGDFLQDGKVVENLPFILFVVLLMLVYISYGYYADNTIRSLSKEEKRSEKLYSELQSLMEIYDQESLQSTVADKLQNKNIFETKDPPRVMWIGKK